MTDTDFEALPPEETAEVPAPQVEPYQGKSKAVQFFLELLETVALSVLFFVLINALTARIRVEGTSMAPTMHSGEFVLVSKLAYRLGEPQIGDVIVFLYPRDPNQEFIKRVIGLPGDKVVIANKQVTVNGKLLQEPYIAAQPYYTGNWTVPQESYFVLGDNRNNSSDSHNWGMVPADNIIGKAVLVYWPYTAWRLVAHFQQFGLSE
ncbi:MAG: signal peptidase I [Chloroflexi bacterium]|nr:signal peptidase I [Chloroflexota bacterium]